MNILFTDSPEAEPINLIREKIVELYKLMASAKTELMTVYENGDLVVVSITFNKPTNIS